MAAPPRERHLPTNAAGGMSLDIPPGMEAQGIEPWSE
jgi:hypothetical protein